MNGKNTLRRAGRLIELCMKPYRWQYIGSIALTFFSSILGTLNPFIIGFAITRLGQNVKDMMDGVPGAGIDYNYIWGIVVLLFVSALVRQAMTYFASYFVAGGVQDSFRDLRRDICAKMNRLPVSYFDKHQKGTILNTVTNDVDAVAGALQQSLVSIVYAITNIIATFILMMVISLPLALLSMLLIPAAFLVSRFMMRRNQKQFRSMQNTLAELNGYIQERYNAFSVVKLYNAEDRSYEGFNELNSKMNRAGFKANFTSGLLAPLMEVLVNITYVTMVILTGYAVLFSGMPLGSMQAFVQYIWLIYEPMGQITQLSATIQSAVASMERIVNFMEEEEEQPEANKPAAIDREAFHGEVKFEHVAFSYTRKRPLITDLTLEAKPGQMVAIVGATGAGKTTIINLLMRFYDIDEGSIAVDGHNIYDMRRENERSLFGMVLQDAWLYHGTIADNIRFGRLDATDEEVIAAAKLANVDHFIRTMPGGYNMMINEEGSNVSLGQKQLLTIARALLADPRVLILDEATSSVDTRLEMLIQLAMKQAMRGRTSFVIAHRLSTIRDADLILVLDSGDIVEQGTHKELLAHKGVYEKLYNSQFAG